MKRANADLVARESDLPGLALLLDPSRLAETLGCGPLKLDYLRLKSGTSCVASYQLGEDWLFAKAVTPDRLAELKDGPDRGELPHRVLPELALQVMPAAADRKMRGLADAIDPQRRPAFLKELRANGVKADRLVPMKLKPQRRLVARLELEGRPVAFLKIHAPDRFAEALIAATLSQIGPAPRLLYANAKSGVIVTEWLDGATLDSNAAPTQFAEAGRLLAKVHTTDLPMASRLQRQDDINAVRAVLDDCAMLLPALSERLLRLGGHLADALLSQPAEARLLHGDFSADQVLIGANSLCLIDWDRSAIGDPASDLGCCLARLDKDVMDGVADEASTKRATDAFLDGYGALPLSLPAQRLRQLALLLTEDFRKQRPNWDTHTEALLARIERDLSALPAPMDGTPDAALPALADALYAPIMAPKLAEAGFELTRAPTLVRHKRGRRAMVRYGAKPHAVLGKIGRKGLDERTVRLHQSLREAGLDGSDPWRVEVPQVVLADAELAMWAMPLLDGEVLDPCKHPLDAFFAAGAALARLHGVEVDPARVWTFDDENAVLEKALLSLSEARPALTGRLDRLVEAARVLLAKLPAQPPVLLHRDFYPEQLLTRPAGIALLDLDLAAMGAAAVDLGNFLAHLQELGLRTRRELAAFDQQGAAFLDGYASVRELPADTAIDALREVSLWRHLAMSQRFDGRRGYFDDLLQHAEAYAGDVL